MVVVVQIYHLEWIVYDLWVAEFTASDAGKEYQLAGWGTQGPHAQVILLLESFPHVGRLEASEVTLSVPLLEAIRVPDPVFYFFCNH